MQEARNISGTAAPRFAAELRRARRAWRRRLALESSSGWLGACLPGLALLFLIALALPPEKHWSVLMAGLAALWIAATLVRALVVPLARPSSLARYACWLEGRAGLARNELSNALALEEERARWSAHPVSRDLVDLAIDRAKTALAGLPLGRLHQERGLRRPLLLSAMGVLPVVLVALLAPLRSSDALRLFLAAGGAGVLPPITLSVTPGESRVEWGESVAVEAAVAGRRRPSGIEIAMHSPRGSWMTAPMVRVPNAPGEEDRDRYGFLISALKGDIEYRVRAKWVESPTYRLSVVHRLQAVGYRKRLEPPAYTGLGAQRDMSATGDLAALVGTRVTLEVLHRRPGISGRLRFLDDPAALDLRSAGEDRLEAAWTVERSGGYSVELRDETEPGIWVSDTFRVEAVPDLAPSVQLLSPPQVIDLPPDMVVPLVIDGVDDFGLTELALVHGRPGVDPSRQVLLRWDPAERRREVRIEFAWDLSEIMLLPGEELSYFLQVTDNDPIRGPKTGETPLATIRFPSMAEMYAQATEQRREDIQSLEETLAGQERLQKDLERVAQEMLRDEGVPWERQQEVAQLLDRQEELGRKLAELQQSLEQSNQRMENQNLFSSEIMTKVREIQDLVGQIQSAEFHQSLEQMQRAMNELDPDALRQAMERMKINQEEIANALDRTLQMLKRLLADEQLDRALQKLEELAARQGEINRQLEMGAKPTADPQAGTPEKPPGGEQADSLAEQGQPLTPGEQAALKAEQEALEQELKKLEEMLENLKSEAANSQRDLEQALEEFMKERSPEKLREQMRQMREAMERSERSLSLRFGRKVREDLQQMHASLSQMKRTIDLERLEQLTRALYDIAHRMVGVSLGQEQLAGTADRHGTRELAAQEQELLEELAAAGDSLKAVSRELPVINLGQMRAVSEAFTTTARARDAFERGSRSRGASLAGEAMRAMNAAVKALLETAAQGKASCSSNCPNPFNRMQCMSEQQSCLNRDTQQAIGACSTPRLSTNQGEALMRLAARQEMIRQGMEELQQGTDGSRELLGNLQSIVDEMKEVTSELRNRNADRRLIERQERILSRLLTAQRSLRKQDQNEERQSRPGVAPAQRLSPAPVAAGATPAERLERAMLRGSQDPVPAEYRRLVDAYLRALLKKP